MSQTEKTRCPTCGEEHTNKRFCSNECRDTSAWSEKVSESIQELHDSGAYGEEWAEKVKVTGDDNWMTGRTGQDAPNYGRSPRYKPIEVAGLVVRSEFEAEVVRAFEASGVEYEYEPIRLEFDEFTYKPDFQVGDFIIEVKGFATESCREKGRAVIERGISEQYIVIQDEGDPIPCDKWIQWPEIDELVDYIWDQATGV